MLTQNEKRIKLSASQFVHYFKLEVVEVVGDRFNQGSPGNRTKMFVKYKENNRILRDCWTFVFPCRMWYLDEANSRKLVRTSKR